MGVEAFVWDMMWPHLTMIKLDIIWIFSIANCSCCCYSKQPTLKSSINFCNCMCAFRTTLSVCRLAIVRFTDVESSRSRLLYTFTSHCMLPTVDTIIQWLFAKLRHWTNSQLWCIYIKCFLYTVKSESGDHYLYLDSASLEGIVLHWGGCHWAILGSSNLIYLDMWAWCH